MRPSAKRLFDICGAGLGLVVLLPLGLLIGVLIKLSDRGPVFFRQVRVGQFGRPFRIWKFRSMVTNADRIGAPLTGAGDPRTTWIGRLLRKGKLDELPQLWNVLVGEMSFVGPRPEVPRYVALYTPKQREILNYKPGLTDLATLFFRNEEALLAGSGNLEGFYVRYCLPRKIELNRQYAERANLRLDLWIILRTLCPYWLGLLATYSVALAFSFWLSYQMRADLWATRQDFEEFKRFLPWILAPQLILLAWQGQMRGLLSYFSIPEMRRTVIALTVAFIVQVVGCHFLAGRNVPSRSILFMDFVLSFFMLCSIRMGMRLLREQFSNGASPRGLEPRRVAIIGTGELATNLVLDFAKCERSGRRVVAFFDDDPRTWHKRPHDIPVVGMPECLLNQEWLGKIDEVIVTLPEENSARIEQLAEMLNRLPLKVVLASGWPVLRWGQV
jgi:lipopolysaccharide/colanic/teichoic acid biosynthesis glycosyltransferase